MATARRENSGQRRTAIADAAIALLAADGSRRLTHRAVDQCLDLPEGSTSAYFRTRASLLAAATWRLAELDREALEEFVIRLGDGDEPASAPQLIAEFVDDWTGPRAAPRQLARLELQLEALRSPELAAVFAEQRSAFIDLVQRFPPVSKSSDPAHSALLASVLTALVDGLIFDRLLHARTAPHPDELGTALAQLLSGRAR